MDYGLTGDIEEEGRESAGHAQADLKSASMHQILAQDSSAPLLGTLMPNSDDDEPPQQRATSSSEKEPSPHPFRSGLILFAILSLPLIAMFGSMQVLVVSEKDPLGVSLPALLLLSCLLLSVPAVLFSVRVSAPYMVKSWLLCRRGRLN
jgi:hypothetical protein